MTKEATFRDLARSAYSAGIAMTRSVESAANAVNNVARWAEVETSTMVREAELEADGRLAELAKKYGLPSPEAA